jgi:hypothetical protein
MRKPLWIIVPALFVAIGALNARADSYTATFACSGPCAGGTPTAPDVSFPGPTSITETWDGLVATFFLPSQFNPTDTYVWCFTLATLQNNCGGLTIFKPLVIVDTTLNIGDIPVSVSGSITTGFLAASGSLTFAAVPEPSFLALMLAGVGLVFVMRKRISQSLPQAG